MPGSAIRLPIVDFSMFKHIALKERYRASRVEAFELFNCQTFVNPRGALSGHLGGVDPSALGNFGYSAATPDVAACIPIIGSGVNLEMRLGLKLTF